MILAALASALSLLAPAPATLLAAGDVASCRSSGDEATAALLAGTPGTIALLGDAVYESGAAREFRNCYAWARFRGRTRAALGNHEYRTGNAAAAIAYFGLPRRGYYSYELGAWHVVVLNSNCRPAGGCGDGSPQQRWLADDLRRHPTRCAIAYMHHPRFSSGIHGPDRTIDALWTTLARGGVDVVLAAHDHHYERFASFDRIRSFVVGTGGRSLYPTLRFAARPRSEVRQAHSYGLLQLTLHAEQYDWRFLAVDGSSFRDAGSAACGKE